MTTGEIAKGRSISAFRNHLPLNLSRTSTRAQATPKIVFSGTATATITSVSQKACMRLGRRQRLDARWTDAVFRTP